MICDEGRDPLPNISVLQHIQYNGYHVPLEVNSQDALNH